MFTLNEALKIAGLPQRMDEAKEGAKGWFVLDAEGTVKKGPFESKTEAQEKCKDGQSCKKGTVGADKKLA